MCIDGTIHALIGPNGAGKTTVFNLLTKFLQPTGGHDLLRGQDITRPAPAAVARLGMVRSFQISAVFPHLTVLDNRARGAAAAETASPSSSGARRGARRAGRPRPSELIADGRARGCSPTRQAAELSYGRKRALEIATTLALDPEVLLLDEPMAGMGHEDIGRIAELDPQASPRTAPC